MEVKKLYLCVALMAIVIGEISGKPNKITTLDKQMTAKDGKTSPGQKLSAKLDPLIEPASGEKVEIIEDDSVEPEDDEANVEAKAVDEKEDEKENEQADEKADEHTDEQADEPADEPADEEIEKRSKMNNYRSNFAYACPNGRSISTFLSAFNPTLRDRQWTVKCDKLLPSGSTGPRFWSTNYGYDNDYKGVLNSICPPQSVMSGLAGYWSQGSYDRRYKIHCTHVWHHKKTHCKWSPWINNWKESAHFTLGCTDRYYVVGMNAVYHGSSYDRRFRVYMCQLQKI